MLVMTQSNYPREKQSGLNLQKDKGVPVDVFAVGLWALYSGIGAERYVSRTICLNIAY